MFLTKGLCILLLAIGASCTISPAQRRNFVRSFNPHRNASSTTPFQVGNGNFAFGADVTGLQAFRPFAIMSSWAWHNFSLPTTPGQAEIDDFTGLDWWTHDRLVNYNMPNPVEEEISNWLIQNPQRMNVANIGLYFQGETVTEKQLLNRNQELDLWDGTIQSTFEYNGSNVSVQVSSHPTDPAVAIEIKSSLLLDGGLRLFFDFSYPTTNKFDAPFVGIWNETARNRVELHSSNYMGQFTDLNGLNLMSIVYCCELDLTVADIEALRPVWWPATAAAALVNDLYSFNKELSTELGTDTTMSNAVWYLMDGLNLTVTQAKSHLVKEKIEPLEHQFITKRAEFIASTGCRDDIRYFLEMVGLGVSANWYWSAVADRFHRYNHPLPGREPVKSLDLDEDTATCSSLLQSHQRVKKGGLVNGHRHAEETAEAHYHKILKQPIEYLRAVPSKNIRGTIIQALNVWLKAPETVLNQVEGLIGHLHDSSLLLDDIQDSSELRRGRPTAHRVFGMPQTINAATYALTLAFRKSTGLIQSIPTQQFFDELENLHLGQAIDLHWTRTGRCPSIEEYLEMIRLKTGALFCLAGYLLDAQSSGEAKQADIEQLMILLGQYFQVRDDYINLASAKYQDEKGFAQDLDEGKFSLPLIHVLSNSPKRGILENILKQRAENACLPKDLKLLILSEMASANSLAFTKDTLRRLEDSVHRQLGLIEKSTGINNFIFRFMLARLSEL